MKWDFRKRTAIDGKTQAFASISTAMHSLNALSQDLENYLARFTKETAIEQIQKISSSCCQKKNWKTAIMNLLKPSVIA